MTVEQLRREAKALLEQDQHADARRLLMAHRDLVPQDKILVEIAKIVGPLRDFPIDEPGLSDSSRSVRWIRHFTNTERYAGQWVALLAGQVTAEASTLHALTTQLEGRPDRNEFLIWYAGSL
jgi:hypothetical protein